MPKAKSKSASGDDSGPPTRQKSTDPVADEGTGVSDDTSQVTNDTSASLPMSQGSLLCVTKIKSLNCRLRST